jgi:hypothetical protein
MRGESVLVRAFKGVPLARQVWDIGERVVYITDEAGFEKLSSGLAAPSPIGFPKEDVFQYDGRLFRRLESAIRRSDSRNLAGIWSEAKPYLE